MIDSVSLHNFIRSVLVADALISAVIGTLEHCVRDDDRPLQTLELASATSQYAVVGSRAVTCDKARRIEAAVTLIGFDLFGTQHWANFSPIWPWFLAIMFSADHPASSSEWSVRAGMTCSRRFVGGRPSSRLALGIVCFLL